MLRAERNRRRALRLGNSRKQHTPALSLADFSHSFHRSGRICPIGHSQENLQLTTLLLPGLDGTGELLHEFAAALPERLNPVIVSYPLDQVLTYRQLEDYVTARLPASGRVVLLGESFSGPIALRVAEHFGERLAAVILVATFVRNPVRWLPGRLRGLVGEWVFRVEPTDALLRFWCAGDDAPAELLEQLRAALRLPAPEVLAGRVRELLVVDATQALLRCPAPILYLGGRHDRLVRRSATAKLQSIRPDLDIVWLEAPHLVLQRQPQAAASIIDHFVRPD